MSNINLYIKTSQPSLYSNRTTYSDYEATLYTESVVPVDKKTSLVDLKVSCKMTNGSNVIPFTVVPSDNISLTPIRFSASPLFINKSDYAVIRLYLDNSCGSVYNIDYGTAVCKIIFNEKFNVVIA
jgi:hypothetical protein